MTTLHFTRGRIAELIADSYHNYNKRLCTSEEHLATVSAYKHLVDDEEVWNDILRISKSMI